MGNEEGVVVLSGTCVDFEVKVSEALLHLNLYHSGKVRVEMRSNLAESLFAKVKIGDRFKLRVLVYGCGGCAQLRLRDLGDILEHKAASPPFTGENFWRAIGNSDAAMKAQFERTRCLLKDNYIVMLYFQGNVDLRRFVNEFHDDFKKRLCDFFDCDVTVTLAVD